MFATHNSIIRQREWRLAILTLSVAVSFAVVSTWAAENAAPRFAAHAQAVFAEAEKNYRAEPTNSSAALQFARSGFYRGDFATNDSERATIAERCIDACRKVIARDPKSAGGHLYLALNLGQLARTKLLGALRIVDEMEVEFKAARALDDKLDHAAADRSLGRLYTEAPAIGSVGNKAKARHHLQRAALISADYPENRLLLAEAYLKANEVKPFLREVDTIDSIWPGAKTSLSGTNWGSAWVDWDQRVRKLREKATELRAK